MLCPGQNEHAIAVAPHLDRIMLKSLGSLLSRMIEPVECNTCEIVYHNLLNRLNIAIVDSQNRDDQQFEQELIQMTRRLTRFAMSLTHNSCEAEDLVQETMMRAWRSRRRFELGTNMTAWLHTIMHNAFINMRTRKSAINAANYEEVKIVVPIFPEQFGVVDLKQAHIALAKIPALMREALTCVAIHNMSYEDAAIKFGVEIGTIKSRVSRARARLAELLGFDGSEVGKDAQMWGAIGASHRVTASAE